LTKQLSRFITGPFLPLSILIVAFLISLVTFAVFHPQVDGRVFYFPDNAGITIGSERRGIPQKRILEEQISIFLNDLALGPVNLELTRTAAKGTKIRHVAVIAKTAFVDLDLRMLKTGGELPISFDQALENLRFNILFNFPRIEEVIFTIEGQQVHAPLYAGLENAE
jgi:hypothetical protein